MPGSSLKRDPMFPEAGEYLGQITTQVILQPLAVGHLVRQGDVEQLRSAAITAAACWGGMYGPILTLDEDGDFTEPASLEILGCLSPDVLVDHAWSKASGWANAATSRVPVEPPRSERLPGQATHSFLVHQPSELRGLHVRIPSEERLVNLVGAGSVPELDRPKWAEYGVILDVVDDNDVAAAQIVGDCPLQMTAVRDHVLSATNPGISTIAVLWVTDRDEAFDDLVGFWNLRALRPSNSRAPTVLRESRWQAQGPSRSSSVPPWRIRSDRASM